MIVKVTITAVPKPYAPAVISVELAESITAESIGTQDDANALFAKIEELVADATARTASQIEGRRLLAEAEAPRT